VYILIVPQAETQINNSYKEFFKVATLKILLLLLLVAICAIGWFSKPILQKLDIVNVAAVPESYTLPKSNFIIPDPVPAETKKAGCITLAEYLQQANSNPKSYYQLFDCGQSAEDRTEADKLINFLQHLKYE
jgi:hypothetical protein